MQSEVGNLLPRVSRKYFVPSVPVTTKALPDLSVIKSHRSVRRCLADAFAFPGAELPPRLCRSFVLSHSRIPTSIIQAHFRPERRQLTHGSPTCSDPGLSPIQVTNPYVQATHCVLYMPMSSSSAVEHGCWASASLPTVQSSCFAG